MLEPGSPAPAVVLTNQHGATVDLVALRGRRVLVFFYPKANTPGCTQQACGLRDVAAALDGTVIVGISPDKPAAQQRFDDKFSLGYDLLADTDHAVAEAFGVWQEKAPVSYTHLDVYKRQPVPLDGSRVPPGAR